MSSAFRPVREVYDGGEGVPVPLYLCQYRGHTLHVFKRGETQQAREWLAGRDVLAAIVCDIDGEQRVVARGTEPAPIL